MVPSMPEDAELKLTAVRSYLIHTSYDLPNHLLVTVLNHSNQDLTVLIFSIGTRPWV